MVILARMVKLDYLALTVILVKPETMVTAAQEGRRALRETRETKATPELSE